MTLFVGWRNRKSALGAVGMAAKSKNKRDAFCAVVTDDYRADTQPLLATKNRRLAVAARATYVEISFAISDQGVALSLDDSIAAMAVRMSVKTFEPLRKTLHAAGMIWPTPEGWMTAMAQRELDRRKARKSSDRASPDHPRVIRESFADHPRQNPKYGHEINGPILPLPYPTHSQEEESSYPTESPDAARAGSSNLISIGLGRGGAVTIDGRRRVCKLLNIGNADPLVEIYERWPKSRNAVDPDRLFAKVAPRLLQNAPPEVTRACQPLNDHPAIARAPLATVQPSTALRAQLATKGNRYAGR
jgi:hypothetical protein